MARVLITGSADGLGLMAARLLLDDGHDVTLHARDDQGPVTQAWLAVSDDPEADVTGRYLYHRRETSPLPVVKRTGLQDALLDYCAELTGTPLPSR
jgi:NAD(P)-dependent dehydrogenase (short-subunit alcohol dehydrogenase family)